MGRAKREMSLGLPLLQHPDVRCRSDAAKKRISSLSKPSTCLLLVFLLATASTTCCQEAARKSLACQGLAFLRLPAALLVFGIRNHTVQLKAGALCRSCNGNSILTAGPLSKDVLSMGQRQLRETSRRNEAGSIPDETRGRLLGTLHGQDLSDIALLEGHGERAELGFEAKLSKLVTLNFGFEDLSHSQRGGVSQFQSLACEGQECPSFLPCPRSALADTSSEAAIGSCSNSELVDSQLELNFKEKNRAPSAYVELDPCPDNAERWSVGRLISPRCPNPNVLGKRNVEAEGFKGSSSWSGQVLLLRNVFVTWDGLVFNETHFFFTGGCNANSAALSFPSTTKVVRKAAAVNLLQSHDGHARMVVHREIIDKLPLLLSLAPIMPSLKGRGAVFLADSKFLRHVAFHFSGLELAEMGVSLPSKDHLFFVEVLIQPFLQPCLYPSPALWRSFRSRHLLPPNGLPMFNSKTWGWRSTLPLGSSSEEESELGLNSLSKFEPVPRDWLVVVASHVRSAVREADLISEFLHASFSKERVVEYSGSIDINEVKSLFNRAVLFITIGNFALSHLMFMPPNATVLNLLASDTPSPDSPSTSPASPPSAAIKPSSSKHGFARAFAYACDVNHFSLVCSAASDSSGISCSFEATKAVVDRAAAAVFTSPAAHAAAVAAAGDFSGLIPGSRLKSREQVEAFKSWMGCISREGSWQYDPTPRILPWNYQGGINLCDHRHRDIEGGLVTEAANRIVEKGAPAEEWTVRESLKYSWRVPTGRCKGGDGDAKVWEEFNRQKFCDVVGRGRTLLLLGDSLMDQMMDTFINNLLSDYAKPAFSLLNMTTPQECIDWALNASPLHTFCRDIVFQPHVCAGFKLRYIRNDHLWLTGNDRVFDHIPWFRDSLLQDADIIVLNRGAHFVGEEDFEKGIRDAMAFIRNRYPEKVLIFRNTPPGHANCEDYTKPIPKRQDPKNLPYDWDKFYGEGKKVESFAGEFGAFVMDVDTMTALRADGHQGFVEWGNFTDCLHYCTPGPVDLWIQQLYNILLRLF